jgi:hypothetical protein
MELHELAYEKNIGLNDIYRGDANMIFDQIKDNETITTKNYLEKYPDNYKMEYSVLNLLNSSKASELIIRKDLNPDCEMFSNVNLVLENPDNLKFEQIIDNVTLVVGRIYFDVMNVEQMKLSNWFAEREVLYNDTTITIPLTFSFFENVVLLNKIDYVELKIAIRYKPEFKYKDAKFNVYANFFSKIENKSDSLDNILSVFDCNRYFVKNGKQYVNDKQVFYQNSFTIINSVKKGLNVINLPFNHQLFLLCIKGLDKPQVKHINMKIDSISYYDGDASGFDNSDIGLDGLCFTFGKTPFNKSQYWLNPTLNASRIDSFNMYIDVDIDEDDISKEIEIYVVNLNYISMDQGGVNLECFN